MLGTHPGKSAEANSAKQSVHVDDALAEFLQHRVASEKEAQLQASREAATRERKDEQMLTMMSTMMKMLQDMQKHK